jgi:hypothetical protein
VEHAFVIVVVAVGIVGILGAAIALLVSRGTWDSLGRDRLLMESDLRDPRAVRPWAVPGTQPVVPSDPAAVAARDEEIRQMLDARNRRRRRLGQAELEVEAELARLTQAPSTPSAPAGGTLDEELLTEIRQLVLARNRRRARRGEPPLDVEAEIARQIARLNG